MTDTSKTFISSPIIRFKNLFRIIENSGFFHLLSSNLLVQLFGFGSFFLVAWLLVPADFGRILILQSYIEIFSVFCGLGLTTSVLKLCSEKRSQGEKIYLFHIAQQYTFITTFMVYLAIFFISRCYNFFKDNILMDLLPIYSLILLPKVINLYFTSYLRALKEFKSLSVIQTLTKLVSVCLVLILTYFFHLQGYVCGLVIGYFLTTCLLYFKIKAIHNGVITKTLNNAMKLHWSYSKYALVANFITRINMYIDMVIISSLIKDASQAGYFAFAKSLLIGFTIFITTVQQIATPSFSERSNDFLRWKTIFFKYQKLFIFVSCLIMVASIYLAGPVLHVLFHGKYDSSIIYFKILCLAWLVRTLYSLKGPALIGLGKININAASSFLALPFSTACMYVLTLKFGLIGTAYGNLISNLISYFLLSYFFYKMLNQQN